MKKTILALSIVTSSCALAAPVASAADVAAEIIGLERKAMDGWLAGDPDSLLAIADPDITYFHVMTKKRADGLAALKVLVEPYRGRSLFSSYQMLEPKVQVGKDMAVLTYVLVRATGATSSRWNATEVYQKKTQGWRVIHTHWSQTAPPLGPAPQR